MTSAWLSTPAQASPAISPSPCPTAAVALTSSESSQRSVASARRIGSGRAAQGRAASGLAVADLAARRRPPPCLVPARLRGPRLRVDDGIAHVGDRVRLVGQQQRDPAVGVVRGEDAGPDRDQAVAETGQQGPGVLAASRASSS